MPCERLTWKPGRGGRNWVCDEDDSETACQWCQDEEWHSSWRRLHDQHVSYELKRAYAKRPYHSHFKPTDVVARLVAEYGSAPKALDAVVNVPYEDFYRHLPSLIAWDMTNGEASREWMNVLARCDKLVPGWLL